MSPRQLTWTVEGGTVLLSGVIDEFADLPSLQRELTGGDLTIDLGGVQRINSIGVRGWVGLMTSLAGKKLRLRRCSPPMVEQLNCIKNFSGGAQVESVMLPYACNKDGSFTIEQRLDGPRSIAAVKPTVPCPSCGADAEFDDLPERYLSFTRY